MILVATMVVAGLAAAGAATAAHRARPAPPTPQAAAWIVTAPGQGGVLVARHANTRRAVASLTKLMTARLVLARGELGRVVVVRKDAATVGESVVGLRAGEHQRVLALLEALLVPSANDAAVALADDVGGTQAAFVRHMNAEARRLGLRHTHYRTPYGLDTPGQYSSASDVLRLAQLDMQNPVFRSIVRRPRGAIPGHSFVSRNDLLTTYAGTDGVKTGHTNDAGWNLVASAERNGVRLYAVVLGSPTQARRDLDVARLLNWGFDQFDRATIIRSGERVGEIPVAWTSGTVPVAAAAPLRGMVRLGERLEARLSVPDHVEGPVPAGTRVGELTVVRGGAVVGRVPVVVTRSVGSPSLLDKARWLGRRTLRNLTSLGGLI
jgi:D-alanyl-D-alanine carboxypeptidase (penicillin-binding protein 5/6)